MTTIELSNWPSRISNLNSTKSKERTFCLFVPYSFKRANLQFQKNPKSLAVIARKGNYHNLKRLAYAALSRHSSSSVFSNEYAVMISTKLPETLRLLQCVHNTAEEGNEPSWWWYMLELHVKAAAWSKVEVVFLSKVVRFLDLQANKSRPAPVNLFLIFFFLTS